MALPIPSSPLWNARIWREPLVAGGQALYEINTTKVFPVASRYVTDDGRVFRYSRCAVGTIYACYPEIGAYNTHGGGATNTTNCILSAVAPTQAAPATGVAGCTCLTTTVASTSGEAGDGVVAVDELVGGYAIIGNGSAQHPDNRLIVGNTAVASGGGTMTVWLDEPLVSAITATTTYVEIVANPYSAIRWGTGTRTTSASSTGNAYSPWMGIPHQTALTGEYFWLQTWGPCWITNDSDTNDQADDRELYFVDNGSVASASNITFTAYHPLYQHAGFCMQKTAADQTSSPLVMLQISI